MTQCYLSYRLLCDAHVIWRHGKAGVVSNTGRHLDDASLKASEIDVDTDQGVVRLSGFVGSAEDGAP
jgi:hyperosmotically inducible protein